MINSLYIKNYKLFKEFRVDSFAQVNLIIGKNNVGKTSLLEALMLFSDDKNIVRNIFKVLRVLKLNPNLSSQQYLEILTTIFHSLDKAIFIGANEKTGNLISLKQAIPNLVIKHADDTVEEILLSTFQQTFDGISHHHYQFVSGNYFESDNLLAQRWGMIALSEKEQYLIDALKIIDNNIERLAFIDEFATGLHWSVQTALWKMIFQLSLKLNIQIFATTHSLDTLSAFQEIAKNDDTNVAVIKLQSFPKKDKIKAVHFKTEEIMIAVEQNIEVR